MQPRRSFDIDADASTDGESLNRLLFRKLMPILVIAYVISFLDRTNIALAKTHLAADLGISSAAYGLGAGLFFLSYALLEIPSNLMLKRVGARWWIARIMVTWGVLSAAMSLVSGQASFYVMRVLLGAAEAGLFPGVMLYLTYWFGREARARATGYFLLGVCIANILGGPLGGALLSMDGALGWRGWQWMFLLEGIPAVLLAIVVWARLPDGPSEARWLSAAQRQALTNALAREQEEDAAAGHTDHSMRGCVTDPQIWLAILVYFVHQISVYTVIFFLPGIISKYGALSSLQIGSLNSLPWIASAAGAIVLPMFATTASRSRRMLCGGLVIMAVGLVLAAWGPPVIAMLGFVCTATMFFVVQSILFVFPASRLAGTGLAGGLALVNTCGLIGGFLGPTVMGLIEQTTGSTTNGLLTIAVLLIVTAACATRLRQGHERSRAAAMKPVSAEGH